MATHPRSRPTHLRPLAFEHLENRTLLTAGADLNFGLSGSENGRLPEETAVRFRIEVTDQQGVVQSQVRTKQNFYLNVYVEDVRHDAGGVFAAYLDLAFDAVRIARAGRVVFGDRYPNVNIFGGSAPGLLDEVGGVSGSLQPIGKGEHLLFRAPFRAQHPGLIEFDAEPADNAPNSLVLVYGGYSALAPSQIDFGSATLDVLPSQASFNLVDPRMASRFAAVPTRSGEIANGEAGAYWPPLVDRDRPALAVRDVAATSLVHVTPAAANSQRRLLGNFATNHAQSPARPVGPADLLPPDWGESKSPGQDRSLSLPPRQSATGSFRNSLPIVTDRSWWDELKQLLTSSARRRRSELSLGGHSSLPFRWLSCGFQRITWENMSESSGPQLEGDDQALDAVLVDLAELAESLHQLRLLPELRANPVAPTPGGRVDEPDESDEVGDTDRIDRGRGIEVSGARGERVAFDFGSGLTQPSGQAAHPPVTGETGAAETKDGECPTRDVQ